MNPMPNEDKAVTEAKAPLRRDDPRLLDLVRQMRAPLHEDGLITDQEYADLAAVGSISARRLETYDDMRVKLALADALRDAAQRSIYNWKYGGFVGPEIAKLESALAAYDAEGKEGTL